MELCYHIKARLFHDRMCQSTPCMASERKLTHVLNIDNTALLADRFVEFLSGLLDLPVKGALFSLLHHLLGGVELGGAAHDCPYVICHVQRASHVGMPAGMGQPVSVYEELLEVPSDVSHPEGLIEETSRLGELGEGRPTRFLEECVEGNLILPIDFNLLEHVVE